jgi:D-alanyl-D-alanine endopeptidase (penicillin-binding protein 7)
MTISKPSVLVYNATDNKILLKTNASVQRPIASITKLMTAMVFLDTNPNLDEELALEKRIVNAIYDGKYSRAEYALPSAVYTKRDLLTAMLVPSDNNAAVTLASCYDGGLRTFVERMNSKAKELGAVNTYYEEPHGSGNGNLSTVEDLSKIVLEASKYDAICQHSIIKQTTVGTTFMENINSYMLYLFNEVNPDRLIKLCKTGLTQASGYSSGIVINKNSKLYTVNILGASSYEERDQMTERLINYMIK